MTDQMQPLTAMDVERRLRQLAGLIDDAHNELKDAEIRYHEAKSVYEVAFARATVQADGRNADEKRAKAVLATEDERHALAIAEAVVRASRANVARLAAQVDITRSVGRLVTSSYDL